MANAIISGVIFFIVAAGAFYGVYKLMQHNGDIASLKADIAKLKSKL